MIGQNDWRLYARPATSALPPKADIRLQRNICREGPCMDGAHAVQEESDVSAKRSGAAMYPACFSRRGLPRRDAAAMAAGPDVIR